LTLLHQKDKENRIPKLKIEVQAKTDFVEPQPLSIMKSKPLKSEKDKMKKTEMPVLKKKASVKKSSPKHVEDQYMSPVAKKKMQPLLGNVMSANFTPTPNGEKQTDTLKTPIIKHTPQ
jgi:hypothetical protein